MPTPCSQACTTAPDTTGRSRGKPAGTGAPQSAALASRNLDSQTVTLVLDTTVTASDGVTDFTAASEQQYMRVDLNNHVLAETVFTGEHISWLDGMRMQVAWARTWGAGRIVLTPAYPDLSSSLESLARLIR